jgi:hypothetical protein
MADTEKITPDKKKKHYAGSRRSVLLVLLITVLLALCLYLSTFLLNLWHRFSVPTLV